MPDFVGSLFEAMGVPMTRRNTGLISIHSVHATGILAGTKTVEVRRRFPVFPAGTRLWIYETAPVGEVTGFVTIKDIERSTPAVLWRRHGNFVGISRAAFETYLGGCAEAVAICLSGPCRVITPIAAARLRTMRDRFHPPQVVTRLNADESAAIRRLSEGPLTSGVRFGGGQ